MARLGGLEGLKGLEGLERIEGIEGRDRTAEGAVRERGAAEDRLPAGTTAYTAISEAVLHATVEWFPFYRLFEVVKKLTSSFTW